MASATLPKAPLWMQNATYPASTDRFLFDVLFDTEGVLNGFGVTPVSGLTIAIGSGQAVVKGDEVANQGKYIVDADAATNLTVAAVGSTRTEYVYLAINDPAVAGGRAGNSATIETGSSVPANSAILLATLQLPAGTSTITAAMITDNRTYVSHRGAPGVMELYSGPESMIPPGRLVCNGGTHNRADHPRLAALYESMGWPYGAGNGTTTFNVPDCRDRVVVAAGPTKPTVAVTGGSTTATLAEANLPAHTHSVAQHAHGLNGHKHGVGTLTNAPAGQHTHTLNTLAVSSTGSDHSHTHSLTAVLVGNHTHYASDIGGVSAMAAGGSYQMAAGATRADVVMSNLSTSGGGAHSHSVTGTISGGAHGHSLTGSLQTVSNHGHTISGETAASTGDTATGGPTATGPGAGVASPVSVEQPYIVLSCWLVCT